MSILDRIRENRNKFLTTMVFIIISATLFNYGLYSLLDVYFNTTDSIYTGVQLNIIFTVTVISIVTILMFILIPKQAVNDMYTQLEDVNNGNNNKYRTPEQTLQDMIDEELEEK